MAGDNYTFDLNGETKDWFPAVYNSADLLGNFILKNREISKTGSMSGVNLASPSATQNLSGSVATDPVKNIINNNKTGVFFLIVAATLFFLKY